MQKTARIPARPANRSRRSGFLNLPRPTRAPPALRATRPEGAIECRARAFVLCVPSLSKPSRGAEGTSVLGDRAQIAVGVRGPRADASESKRRAETRRPVSLASRHTLAGGLAFCVAAQGHAARRRLSERYWKRPVL